MRRTLSRSSSLALMAVTISFWICSERAHGNSFLPNYNRTEYASFAGFLDEMALRLTVLRDAQ